jgi:SAM-dependent methyltransferase
MTTPQAFDPTRWRAFEHESWQSVAEHYHEWLGPVSTQAISPLLDAVAAQRGTRLLDVATGPGFVAALATQQGADVVGVDFSAAMVAEATRRVPGVQFHEADAEALPFPDASFDAVVANFGLNHVGQPERALAEAHRVLRAGGRLGFTVWDRSGVKVAQIQAEAIQAHGDVATRLPESPADPFTDAEQCERTLRAVGFLPPTIVRLPLVLRLDDPDGYFDVVLRGAGPRVGVPLRAQSPQALAAIRAAVREALRVFEKDGVVEIPNPAILVAAQKP